MKIGVISDTHGDQAAVRRVIKLATDVDMWLHAGDCSQDAEYLRGLVNVPVIAARGNCDGQTAARLDEFVEIQEKKIWVTHGHRYNVKRGRDELLQIAKHHTMNLVVYGHTHIPENYWCEDILLFNPGSANCSYGSPGTFGIIEIDEEKIEGSIIDL